MLDLNKLAARQLKDYKGVDPGTCFADPGFALDINSAYQLQDAVKDLRLQEGDAVAGYKIGCIGENVKKQFGMDGPIRGTIFESEISRSPHELSIESFCNLAIEAEMAFVVGTQGKIDHVFPVIELHNLIFRSPKKTLSELVGNNGINAGVIVPSKNFWEIEKLNSPKKITLQINKSIFSTTQIWPIKNSPHGSLDWLQENLESYDLRVRNGNLILAGTTLGLYPVKRGDRITVFLNERATVTCSIN